MSHDIFIHPYYYSFLHKIFFNYLWCAGFLLFTWMQSTVYFCLILPIIWLTGITSGEESTFQCRRQERHGFYPWAGKIPWRKAWQPTPVFLPGESHGQKAWRATVHSITKSWTQLSRLSMRALAYSEAQILKPWLRNEFSEHAVRRSSHLKGIGGSHYDSKYKWNWKRKKYLPENRDKWGW